MVVLKHLSEKNLSHLLKKDTIKTVNISHLLEIYNIVQIEYLKIDRFSGFILFFILHLIYELKDLHFSHLYNSSINTIGDTLGSSIGYLFTLYIIYFLKIKVEGIHVFMSFIIYIFLAVFLFILYEYILNLNQSKNLKLKYFPILFI